MAVRCFDDGTRGRCRHRGRACATVDSSLTQSHNQSHIAFHSLRYQYLVLEIIYEYLRRYFADYFPTSFSLFLLYILLNVFFLVHKSVLSQFASPDERCRYSTAAISLFLIPFVQFTD